MALDGQSDRDAVGWARECAESTNEEGHEGVGGQTVRAGVVTYFLDEGAPERPECGARDFRMRTGGDDLVEIMICPSRLQLP